MGAYLKLLPATIEHVLDVRHLRQERSKLLSRLFRAIELLAAFESLMTICAGCKKIRNNELRYPIEHLIHERVDTRFSHGLCPECNAQTMQKLRDVPP
jgi:hypothetical protein